MGFGSLGFSEMLVIAIIVLIFFGPRRMPEIARSLGHAMREFRRSLNEIQREFEAVEREETAPPPAASSGAEAPAAGTPAAESQPAEPPAAGLPVADAAAAPLTAPEFHAQNDRSTRPSDAERREPPSSPAATPE